VVYDLSAAGHKLNRARLVAVTCRYWALLTTLSNSVCLQQSNPAGQLPLICLNFAHTGRKEAYNQQLLSRMLLLLQGTNQTGRVLWLLLAGTGRS
jgi:hypothetical protein